METFTAVFDGKVFIPEGPVDLEPNSRVRLMPSPVVEVSKEERHAALEWLRQNPAHSGGVDWAEWDRGDVYP